MTRVCLHGFLLLVVLGFFTGCGKSGPPRAEVFGTVTYQGQPLPTGTITFVPQGADLPYAYAEIHEDGSYRASTPDQGSGVAIGSHKIMISAMKDMGPEAAALPLIPKRYSSDQQSGLTAEVITGDNKIDFELSK